MQELIKEMNNLRKELNLAIGIHKQRGQELSLAERNYRVALAKKILTEREKGTPVTIINDIARGDEVIADLKFKRDSFKSLYETAAEKINATKKEIDIVRDDIGATRRGI